MNSEKQSTNLQMTLREVNRVGEVKKNIPKLRFKGYEDAWEQRKLGSEFKKVNERNDGTFGKGHWISVAKMYFQAPEKVQSNNIDTRTYVMRLGDIAFEGHPNNEFQFGRFVANDIGDGVVSELFPVYRHKTPYYNNYWKYAIQQERIMAPIFAKSITSSGNSSNKIDPKHFLRQKVRIATLEEQKNIGDFLVEIDNLITLHQRKYDALKTMKKTLLSKIFPKDGEDVPEIRFKGFTDAWEQRKVAEITKFHKQGYYTTEEYNDNKKYYLLRGTDLTGNKLVLKDTPKIDATEKDYDAFKTEIGDFLIVRSGNVGTYGIVDIDIPAIFGSYLIDFRFDTEKVTNEFFGYFYQSERFQSQLNKITQSSANININAENIKSTYISLPVLIEQKKISNIMSTLDNCITLHQRKLEELKNMKKTLLQQMFV